MKLDVAGILFMASLFAICGLFFLLMGLHARKRLAEIRGDLPDLVTTRRNRTFSKPLLWAAERVAREDRLPPDEPPLVVGDECRLVCGIGPVLLVVDVDRSNVVASWDEGSQEHVFPRTLVRRYKPDEPVRPRKRVSA